MTTAASSQADTVSAGHRPAAACAEMKVPLDSWRRRARAADVLVSAETPP